MNEYKQRQIFYSTFIFDCRIKHFTEMVKFVSNQISKLINKFKETKLLDPITGVDLPCVGTQVSDYIRYTVTTLMMDEFEIACWIKFIDRFKIMDESYCIYSAHQIV